jgi:hypothetical protein
MKLLPSLALIFAAAMAAHADIVVEQKIESAVSNGNMVIKVKGDMARVDAPSPIGQATIIMNFKTGESTTLVHAQKVAVKMDMKAAKAQAEAMQKAAGLDSSKMDKPKATGATETVGEWKTEIYEFNTGSLSGKIWAAKDFPDAQALKDELKKISEASGNAFDPSKMDVPGMPVKSQINTPAGPMTMTLVKAKKEAVEDSEFVIPGDYNEMKMPAIPGAAPK